MRKNGETISSRAESGLLQLTENVFRDAAKQDPNYFKARERAINLIRSQVSKLPRSDEPSERKKK